MEARRRGWATAATLALAAALVTGCADRLDEGSPVVGPADGSTTAPTTAAPPPTAPAEPAAAEPATTVPPPIETTVPTTAPPPPPPPPPPRTVHEQAWSPFAMVEGVVLHHPSARVETVAFHESNHDGARDLQPLATAVRPIILETRERGTGPRTAADVVADPDTEIRAPVTGRVKRAGTYVLYCKHRDSYAVIEPDARPGWEVKVLHIDGVLVQAGDQVVAGETLVAPRPTQLPFESQVDEVTGEPAWPHVHIEVIDPAIPDRPSPGGGC